MQYQTMPFGWSIPLYLPLPPTIDDRDLFINSVVNGGPATPGPAGPEGPPGPQGEPGVGIASAEVTENPGDLILLLTDGTLINAGLVVGPPGPPGGTSRNTVTIVQNYEATPTDYYIGADLLNAATITLPSAVPPGTEYVIKLEFGAPVGTRKLTVQTQAPTLINGVTSLTLNTPYQSISVIYNNGSWWTI
jgi:hypothetical protein